MSPTGPSHAQLLQAALTAFQGGKLDEAIAQCRLVLQTAPGHPDANHILGMIALHRGRNPEAVKLLRLAATGSPANATIHANLSAALLTTGHVADAGAAAHTALRLDPKLADGWDRLGKAQQATGKLEAAETSFRQALAFGPRNPRFLSNLGDLLMVDERPAEAAEIYIKALAIAPGVPGLLRNLANAQLEIGQFAEAAETLERAIARTPQDLVLHRMLAGAVKFTTRDARVQRMEQAAADATLPASARKHVEFALGKAFDDIGDFATAFDHYAEGNRLHRASYRYDLVEEAAHFAAIKAAFSAETFAARAGQGVDDDRQVFIVGMPRSGTTLLEQIIGAHPDAVPIGEFLGLQRVTRQMGLSGAASVDADLREIGKRYLDILPRSASGAGRVVNKLPNNFLLVGLIHLALPNARIIHLSRDPMDNGLSIFKAWFEPSPPPYASDLGEIGHYYNLYRDLMRHWRAVLPSKMMDVTYESLIADPAGVGRTIFMHCGLEWDDKVLEFYRSAAPIKTASFAQARRPVNKDSLNLSERYGSRLDPLRAALAEWRD